MSLDVYLFYPGDNENFELFHGGVTHNLNKMAEAAGIYNELWRPDEHNITTAKQLIEPLQKGFDKLIADSEFFKKFNSPNGWGNYEDFIHFVEKYLEACIQYPESTILADR